MLKHLGQDNDIERLVAGNFGHRLAGEIQIVFRIAQSLSMFNGTRIRVDTEYLQSRILRQRNCQLRSVAATDIQNPQCL